MIAQIRSGFCYLALAVLGAWSVWAQFFYRASQPYLTVLLAVLTLVATGFTLALGFVRIYRAFQRKPPKRLVRFGYRACAVFVGAFTLWGAFLFANGRLDRSDTVPHATEIVGIAGGDTGMSIIPFTWLELRPWREPKRPQRLLVRGDERPRFFNGQPVVVLTRRGYFGVAWVSAVEPDVARQSREILKVAPRASQVYKDLIRFYVRIGSLDEARRTAGEYTVQFPDDRDFPIQVAAMLSPRDRSTPSR
jgi:hypothetical protein